MFSKSSFLLGISLFLGAGAAAGVELLMADNIFNSIQALGQSNSLRPLHEVLFSKLV